MPTYKRRGLLGTISGEAPVHRTLPLCYLATTALRQGRAGCACEHLQSELQSCSSVFFEPCWRLHGCFH